MRKGRSKLKNNPTLREKAEKRLFERPEGRVVPDNPLSIIHELEVHQIELEMQNDELRRAQLEIEKSKEKYVDFYDVAPVGYLTINEKGMISDLNLTTAECFGIERRSLVDEPFSRFIHPKFQDTFYFHRREVLRSSVKQTCELVLIRNDGTVFQAQLDSIGVKRERGEHVMRTVLTDISERKLAEGRIKSLLTERELLLREVHHGMKNTMGTILGLLSLQASSAENPSVISSLKDARSRIQSMMVLYDKLYRSTDFRKVSPKEYLTSLTHEIIGNFPNHEQIVLEIQIDASELGANILSPVGIIINELLTNTMKHAFIGREEGLIRVHFSLKDNHAILIVYDNGIGIHESVDITRASGFGMQLIQMLTEQLEGTIRLERKNGTKIILEFEV